MAEDAGIPVERRFPYGDSFDCFDAIKNGKLDLYPEYDGTMLTMLGRPPTTSDLEKLGLQCGKALGFSNPFVLVVENSDVDSISDLTEWGRIRFALPPEFLRRHEDGMDALLRRYGLERSDVTVESDDKDVIYKALANAQVDVAVGFGTDSHLAEHRFQILTDDLQFVPAYEAMPLVRQDALKRYDNRELLSRLNDIAGRLTAQQMCELVREIEVGGSNPRDVAVQFLKSEGLLESKSPQVTGRRDVPSEA